MSSDISYPFAISRIRANESSIITANTWTRLWEASIPDCFRLLTDVNYAPSAEKRDDIDLLTKDSVTSAREFISEVSPNPEWTNLFIYPVDGENIKTILKGLVEREETEQYLLPGGTISIENLLDDFERDNFEDLPTMLRRAVEDFNPDDKPDVLSAKIDASVYAQIFSVLKKRKYRNELLEKYFKLVIDTTNILSVIRARNLDWEVKMLSVYELPGGEIPFSSLDSALKASDEELVSILSVGEKSTEIRKILEDYFLDKNIIRLETRFKKLALNVIHEDYTHPDGIGPIVNYLLEKEFEARALRLLFAYKRLGREVSLEELGVL